MYLLMKILDGIVIFKAFSVFHSQTDEILILIREQYL